MTCRRLTTVGGLLVCWGILVLSGCDDSTSTDSSATVNESQFNNGWGRSRFMVTFGGHMFNGEVMERTADVHPGSTYNAILTCSNDGDADAIVVKADGNQILVYRTAENRMSGRGWYVDQEAACLPFVAVSSQVVFQVQTYTDGWGTWPQSLLVTEVSTNQLQ
ncbi:MAG: hypothetical protein WCN95_06475 [bacterium]